MGEVRNAHSILTGKPEGKKLLESPEYRREDVEWIHLALGVAQ
jgi:hypothetical protein